MVHRLSPDSDVFENMHANRFTTDDFEDKTFSVALKIIHTVRQFNNYVVHVCSVVANRSQALSIIYGIPGSISRFVKEVYFYENLDKFEVGFRSLWKA